MSIVNFLRKSVALICFAALLGAALSSTSYVLFSAILVPFFILFGILVGVSAEVQAHEARVQKTTFSAAIPARAPPLDDPLT
jgi:hypothetical protein